eukprot:m.75065 g.75065  ORF g.75065 m.75065 type:complete len:291 (-) comp24732_c0_seq1:285-1157(-)
MSTKKVFVTGANKGIGLAIVEELLESEPDTYVLLGSRNLQRGVDAMKSIVAQTPEFESRIEVVEIDVCSKDSIAKAAASVEAKHGKACLYALINNAGIAAASVKECADVNYHGVHDVSEAFIPLVIKPNGKICIVGSAAGPNFVAKCAPDKQAILTNPKVTLHDLAEVLTHNLSDSPEEKGYPTGGFHTYGLSKALVMAYTMYLQEQHPTLVINSVTPGFIDTDLTKPFKGDKTAEEAGMKGTRHGAQAVLHTVTGDLPKEAKGWYFGSDKVRSPLDRYRSPGDPPYTGN